jgi:hypothetical protein
MKVLVACEQSQVVTEQFILLGHDAMSCDLNYDGEKGLPHYRGDVRDLLTEFFDLVIFHPVCKFITNSGVRWLDTDITRWKKMYEGCQFFNLRHKFNSPCVATENPIPHKYAVGYIGMYDQLFQPYNFGHKEMKATCLWLKGLPHLRYTSDLQRPKTEQERKEWSKVHRMAPGPDRERLRSVTYTGVAKAMAEQWSEYILNRQLKTA